MIRVSGPTVAPNLFGEGKHGFRSKNPGSVESATIPGAAWMNHLQEAVCRFVEGAGIALDPDNYDQLTDAFIARITGLSRPYDISFIAGFAADGVAADLAVHRFGLDIVKRDWRIYGAFGGLETAPTGAALTIDVKKNGATIFATKPQFNAGGTNLIAGGFTGGADHVDFAPGDHLDVYIDQVGSTIKGQGLRFGLLGVALS